MIEFYFITLVKLYLSFEFKNIFAINSFFLINMVLIEPSNNTPQILQALQIFLTVQKTFICFRKKKQLSSLPTLGFLFNGSFVVRFLGHDLSHIIDKFGVLITRRIQSQFESFLHPFVILILEKLRLYVRDLDYTYVGELRRRF